MTVPDFSCVTRTLVGERNAMKSILWHWIRLHRTHNTGACDMYGTPFTYCVTCQERGIHAAWRGNQWADAG